MKCNLKVAALVTTLVAGLVIWLVWKYCRPAGEPVTFSQTDLIQENENELQKADSLYNSYNHLHDIGKDSIRAAYKSALLARIRAGAVGYSDTLRITETDRENTNAKK